MAQWVGRAPNGADTFGTHYSEFEVEIGALPGSEQQRILREIRATLSGERGGVFPGVTFAVNTFLTERIEETITGFAAPLAVNLYGTLARCARPRCAAVAVALSRRARRARCASAGAAWHAAAHGAPAAGPCCRAGVWCRWKCCAR